MSTITLTLTTAAITAGAGDTPATLIATVTNTATMPARVVLGAFGPAAGSTTPSAVAWVSIERQSRDVAAGATEQFTVTVAPPAQTAGGDYAFRLIAYDSDRAPEEYSDQAQQVAVTVPSRPAPPAGGVPWWIYLVAGVLVLTVGVVAFWLLRPREPEPLPSPSPTMSSTEPNPCPEPFVPRLARPGDLTCVMPASAEEAQWDNREDVQRDRVIPDTDPPQCQIPYLPRLAFPDDYVCVWEDTANRTHVENQEGYTEHMFNDKEYPETFTPRR